MRTPNASHRHERLNSSARTLQGLLRPASEPAAAIPARDLPLQAWEDVLGLALRHGVAPLLLRALEASGVLAECPDHVRTRLEQERRATALDNLRKYGQFRRIAQVLQAQGIPVIALKGMHLAELVYRDISLRPMSDVDILVSHPDLKRTIATLQTLEYGFDSDMAGAADAMFDSKCNVGLAHRRLDIWLEVHWTLSEPLDPYSAPLEDIWHSAMPARLGDAEAMVMSPEFLLLHVCAHLACNHVFRFSVRALCDIAEIVRAYPALDWTIVTDQGRRHGWGRGVAVALKLARDYLGVAIPTNVLTRLGGDMLDPELVAEALEHLLTCRELPDELNTAPNLLAFAGGAGPGVKIATLWKRVFVPRAELALIYGVPEHSARIILYYLVRLRDLIRKYAASAWALSVSDPQLSAIASRHVRLAKWIAGA